MHAQLHPFAHDCGCSDVPAVADSTRADDVGAKGICMARAELLAVVQTQQLPGQQLGSKGAAESNVTCQATPQFAHLCRCSLQHGASGDARARPQSAAGSIICLRCSELLIWLEDWCLPSRHCLQLHSWVWPQYMLPTYMLSTPTNPLRCCPLNAEQET